MDSTKRTIVKSGAWTLLGLAVMAGVGWLITGSAGTGGALAVLNSVIGLVTYVVYERVWARISWGRHG